MTDTPSPSTGSPRPSSPFAGIAALVAGVLGVGLLVFGIVRLVGSIETDDPTPTVAFVTTTEAPMSTTTAATATPTTTAVPVGDVMQVTDDSGDVSIEVPAAWMDVSGSPWGVDGTTVGLSISAAIDRVAWYEGWGTPGLFLGISTVSLDAFTPEFVDFSGACTYAQTGSREYAGFTAVVEEWIDCGDEGSDFATALIWPTDFAWSGLIQVVTLDGSSVSVLDHAINTLSYER